MEGLYVINNSINTNFGAMVALENLSATQTDMAQTQSRISTGLKVSSAKDDGATWAIAQSQRATSLSLNSVKDSLSRGSSIIDVALSAGQSVSDLLLQMKAKALAASDSSLDANSRSALNEDFKALRDQITSIVSNADFNGANLLASGASNLEALANSDGTSRLTATAEDLSLGGANVSVAATDTIGTSTTASAMIATLQSSIANVSAALARLGTKAKAFDAHAAFVSKLQDTIDAGVGNLVDADLAKESAKFQALQTKQQLGVQALSIANQSPSAILSLFR